MLSMLMTTEYAPAEDRHELQQLLIHIAGGEREALAELYQRTKSAVYGLALVTQAVVPLQIEPQTSRCTPAQEVTIQKDGISISMHGVSSDMVIAIVRGLLSC